MSNGAIIIEEYGSGRQRRQVQGHHDFESPSFPLQDFILAFV